MKIAGIILAGGKSERMGGREKTLLEIGGRPIIAHVADNFRPQVEYLAISANGDPQRFDDTGLEVVADADPGRGPLAGILAGMEWAASKTDATHLATAAGDTPFLPGVVVSRLKMVLADDARPIALAATGQTLHPVFGLWPLELRAALADWLSAGEKLAIADFAAEHGFVTTNFPIRQMMNRVFEPFMNVNTPEELERARAFHAEFLA